MRTGFVPQLAALALLGSVLAACGPAVLPTPVAPTSTTRAQPPVPPPTAGDKPSRTPAPPTLAGSPAAFQPKVVSDGRIGIAIDRIERSNAYPLELPTASGATQPSSEAGREYFAIYVTITNVERGIFPVANRAGPVQLNRPSVIDREGRSYLGQGRGSGELTIGAEGIKVGKGYKFVFAFEVPQTATPWKFTFFYPFQESWEQRSPETYRLDVELD